MIALRVNGEPTEAAPEPRTSLADCLRDELLLTGTHLGCEHGVCGACTLMLDGEPVRSCLTLAVSCGGADVRTIEGFDGDRLMAALRAAFSRHHALQCGYCTPGMLMTAYDIVRRLPGADEGRIRLELAGNLCRCTGYQGIVEAIADVLRDPPPAGVLPVDRPVARDPADPAPRPSALAAVATASAPPVEAVELPADDLAGLMVAKTLAIPASADSVWPLLRDIEAVAALLPGAVVAARRGDEVDGSFTASLGPIRARFTGRAAAAYDDARRTGRVRAAGGDRLTRSGADGLLDFSLRPDGPAACAVEIGMTYRLKGPLAQFGRPAVVEALVDGLLARFAANLDATIAGRAVDARPMGLRAALAAVVRRLLRRRRPNVS